MRIITGSARGISLRTLDGELTRPTAERVKEAVFSMVQFELEGRRVLDLFAGSGQLGLEALSRGASSAVFVDSNTDACAVVRENALKTKLADRTVVLNIDAARYLKQSAGREKFDIVLIDPPYAAGLIPGMLQMLAEGDIIKDNGVIVCESDKKTPFELEGFNVRRHNRYGRIFVTLLERSAPENDGAEEEQR